MTTWTWRSRVGTGGEGAGEDNGPIICAVETMTAVFGKHAARGNFEKTVITVQLPCKRLDAHRSLTVTLSVTRCTCTISRPIGQLPNFAFPSAATGRCPKFSRVINSREKLSRFHLAIPN